MSRKNFLNTQEFLGQSDIRCGACDEAQKPKKQGRKASTQGTLIAG